jgi:hypothetical protein
MDWNLLIAVPMKATWMPNDNWISSWGRGADGVRLGAERYHKVGRMNQTCMPADIRMLTKYQWVPGDSCGFWVKPIEQGSDASDSAYGIQLGSESCQYYTKVSVEIQGIMISCIHCSIICLDEPDE